MRIPERVHLHRRRYQRDVRTREAGPAVKLVTRQVAKPWGRNDLPAPFHSARAERIGEIWFEPPSGPALPLMVKYLFTSDKLSIQVHPNDAQAHSRGLSGGKEECWLVIDAQPDAVLGIGTLRALTSEELRQAATDGTIEDLIDWKPAQRGDFFYIPAGTVHAIGAGISLIEIQQNADVTYRLYDYGRPRELHLDDGVAVARAVPYSHRLEQRIDFQTDQFLVDGPLFRLRLTGNAAETLPGSGPMFLIPIEGHVTVGTDDGPVTAAAGECLAITPGAPVEASSSARVLIARAS